MAVSRTHKTIRILLAVFWLAVMFWMVANMQAYGVDAALLESTRQMTVTQSAAAITFTPAVEAGAAALVFYPGALVDPEAYVPMARAVADAGFPVVLLTLPFRFAPFEKYQQEVTDGIVRRLEADGGGHAWVVGGHSRGGKLAAQFAASHAELIDGLLLVGTSHPRRDDLSHLMLDVTKVFGTEDGLASETEVQDFAANLPEATHWVRIEGGNHAQFAWYGKQLGDHYATISRSEQQRQLVYAIIAQLNRLASGTEAP